MGVKLIAAGMLLWGLGYGLHSFMLPVHLRSIGCTPEQVGLVFSAGMAAMALSALPGGWLADRFERRRVIRISWLAGAPSALLYHLARDHRLAAVGMALYFGAQAGYPALNAYVASAAGVGRSGSTFGIVNAAFAGGMVAGPMLGGWIAGRWSANPVFLMSFALFLAAAAIMYFLPAEGQVDGGAITKDSAAPAGAVEGYMELLRHSKFVRFVAVYSVCAFAFYMVQPLFAQFLADVWQGDAAAVGVLGTLMSLGQVVITAAVGKVADARGSIVAVAGNMFVFIGAMLCYVYVPSAALRLACMFLLGGFMAGQGVIYAGVGEILGPKAGGKAFALLSLAMAGVSVVGPYLGGFLYAGSPARPFVVAGAIAAAGALALARLGIAISSVRGGEVGQGTGTLGTDG